MNEPRVLRVRGGWRRELRALMGAWLLSVPLGVAAQDAPPAESEAPRAGPRPGLWRLGPFYVTPKFRIGSIGLDTNVLYTPTERTTDISASGGPGLELVLPLGRSGRFYSEGFIDYLYFIKTDSQRKLSGSARGGFDFTTPRSSVVLEEAWAESYARPSFEVNQRVRQTTEGTHLDIKRRLFGRISVLLAASREHYETPSDSSYLGADLQKTLTRDTYRAGGGLDYAITVKTSFVVEDEQRWDRFPLDPLRDGNSNRIWAGFRTGPTALISGQALVGRRFFDFQNSPVSGSATVASVTADWNISPKTKLGGSYGRDLTYSALPVVGLNPLLANESYEARIDKFLVGGLNLKLFGRVSRVKSDDPVAVDIPGEGPVVKKRNDKYRQVGADLGYYVRPKLRVGVAASYGTQSTTIDYFGIDGLIVGATVRYNP
jgi:Putative beta-barrel porin 2